MDITLPMKKSDIALLRVGDKVTLTGEILVMRDAAHKRYYDTVKISEKPPVDIAGESIYYMGPTPARDGNVIGSAGPTTSSRMDKYTPEFLGMGLCGMIGKGARSGEVKRAIKENGAVYFAAVGGCGALLSKCIEKNTVICYEDLGTEAVRRIYVRSFPCIVAVDSLGNDIYE